MPPQSDARRPGAQSHDRDDCASGEPDRAERGDHQWQQRRPAPPGGGQDRARQHQADCDHQEGGRVRGAGRKRGRQTEPIARGDGFELCRVLAKIEPHADDPTVKLRIDQRLLNRHFSELMSKYTQSRLGGVSPAKE